MANQMNRDLTSRQHDRHMEWVENDQSPWGHWSFRHSVHQPASRSDMPGPDTSGQPAWQDNAHSHEQPTNLDSGSAEM
jgi:hypothetical protein